MVWLKKVLFLGTALVVATSLGTMVTAQPTTIEFVAPSGTLVVGSGDTGDVVVITGRSLGWREAGDCAGGPGVTFPLQMGVALDPGDRGRAPRTTEISPITSEPLRPGTRLKNLQKVSDCTVGGEAFGKFNGDFE